MKVVAEKLILCEISKNPFVQNVVEYAIRRYVHVNTYRHIGADKNPVDKENATHWAFVKMSNGHHKFWRESDREELIGQYLETGIYVCGSELSFWDACGIKKRYDVWRLNSQYSRVGAEMFDHRRQLSLYQALNKFLAKDPPYDDVEIDWFIKKYETYPEYEKLNKQNQS